MFCTLVNDFMLQRPVITRKRPSLVQLNNINMEWAVTFTLVEMINWGRNVELTLLYLSILLRLNIELYKVRENDISSLKQFCLHYQTLYYLSLLLTKYIYRSSNFPMSIVVVFNHLFFVQNSGSGTNAILMPYGQISLWICKTRKANALWNLTWTGLCSTWLFSFLFFVCSFPRQNVIHILFV